MSLKTEGDISPELKVAARDLHYTLIEQYGLKDDPVSNHAIREGLHQLMRLAATASEKLLADEVALGISVRETLKSHINEMGDYLEHHESCPWRTHPFIQSCTCGLDALMKKGIAR